MKVKRLSRQGNMLLVEDPSTTKGERWYFLASNVAGYAKTLKEGDDVEIQASNQNGNDTISFIKKSGASGGGAVADTHKGSAAVHTPPHTFEKKTYTSGSEYGKSPEVQESIKRQAIGHMTSRTLIALQGQVDVNNVKDLIDTIYAKYVEVVG